MTQVTASLSEEDFGAILALMRQRDYVIKRQLGKGGCGRTLLLLDTSIGEELVCKEYAPANERRRQDLFDSFVREIKLMLRVNHENVVRIYHHYIYPDLLQGFILMEHVNGFVIDRYLESKPERINHVFVQAVAGFAHLQRVGILHRDIRIANLMVRHDDTVKIIDLGFGKQVRDSDDFDNSTKITRWCPDPYDFSSARYDFCTEVYFVGSLFRKLIFDLDKSSFRYPDVLRRMCELDPAGRPKSFDHVQQEVGAEQLLDEEFTGLEKARYVAFADAICRQIRNLEVGAEYCRDPEAVQKRLTDVYPLFMLEVQVPDAEIVISCFFDCGCVPKKDGLPVERVKDFLQLLRGVAKEKRQMIFNNLHNRFDSIDRKASDQPDRDDIEF